MRTPLIVGSFFAIAISSCTLFSGEPDPRWVDYKSWTSVVRGLHGDPSESLDGVHEGENGYRNVFVNNVGKEMLLGDGPYAYPIGTVVVKEQYSTEAGWQADTSPTVTVMLKVGEGEGADTWNWAVGTGSAGPNGFCSKCHDNVDDDDFVFTNGAFLGDGDN